MNNFQQFQNPLTQPNNYINNQYLSNRYTNPYITNTTQNNSIIWVQGVEGAKAYQLSPNSIVILMDSDTDGRFYIKTSDNVGMCTLRVFDFTEVTNSSTPQNATPDMTKYVTREEFDNLVNSLHINNNSDGGNKNGKQSISTTKSNNKSRIPE